MPDDEAFEYLPTQAIADFLATENEPVLDGLVFPSVQAAGDELNVVLFHKAAHVEAMEIPEGTEVEARTGHTSEDGWEVDYSVSERVPPKEPPKEKDDEDQCADLAAFVSGAWHAHDADLRDATLRIDLECAAFSSSAMRTTCGDTGGKRAIPSSDMGHETSALLGVFVRAAAASRLLHSRLLPSQVNVSDGSATDFSTSRSLADQNRVTRPATMQVCYPDTVLGNSAG